ncbi:MAG: peptidylprolyl isomerase, partial [Candidatus Saganbacteria bacterium]|nr:peptidylprolyl isomerase [Candidatus Saganbacteria bacterium]
MFKFFRKNMKWILIVVTVIFAASVFYGLGYQALQGKGEQGGKVEGLAKVNGMPISALRFNQNINILLSGKDMPTLPQDLLNLQSLALDQTIDYTLVLNEAKKKERVSGEEVNMSIQGMMKAQGIKDETELKSILKKNGLDYGQFKDMIKDDILVQKLSMSLRNVTLTPNDLREVQVQHILIMPKPFLITGESNPKKKEAKAWEQAKKTSEGLLARIRKGEDFGALAKEFSDDPGSKSKGGDLGYFAGGKMVPEFETAAFNLKIGEVSGLVKTEYGYHILKLENTRLRKVDTKGGKLEDVLLAEKRERAFRDWFTPIKQKAKIEIQSPLLKANNLRLQGKVQESMAEFMNAARLEPTNPYPYIMIGDTYEILGDLSQAISEYLRAIEIAPGNVYGYLCLGKAYSKLGDQAKASASFEKASLIAGGDQDAHKALAKAFKSLGFPAQAA